MKCRHVIFRSVLLCKRYVMPFAFLFALSSGIVRAQAVVTTDVSPDFGYAAANTNLQGRIPGMVIDPNNNSVMYAAGEWSGVWKSTNGAQSWALSSTGLRNGVTQQFAYPNLAIDSTNSQRLLYATTSKDGRGFTCEGCQFGGLWVSINAAQTWQHVNLCSTKQQADNIASVVFASGSPFVATDCGIWTTTDPNLQINWTTMTLPNGITPAGTIFAPFSSAQTLFACLGGGARVYRSLNLGKSWDAGVDVSGNCTGLAVGTIPNETQPSTSVVIHSTSSPVTKSGPGSNALEVTVVNHNSATTQNLGFANVAVGGSGRSGVWTAPRNNPASGGSGPGVSYDVFAADNLYFYRYSGNNAWSSHFPVHVDSWWMAFPNTYNSGTGNCFAYSANDGGIFGSFVGSCNFDAWIGTSAGLHVTWGNHISGLPMPSTNSSAQACAGSHGGQPCPLLYLPTTDDDTFIHAIPNYLWSNFLDGLGDAGEVLIDPAQPNLALACRNGNYNLFVAAAGQFPTGGNFFGTIAQGTDYTIGIQAPTSEAIKQVLTMPGETVLTNGDFMAVQSAYSTNLNNCVQSKNCGNDLIVRNVSAALGQQQAQSSWFDISPEVHFGPGQVAGIYPSGGHNTTVYVLTSNASGVNYNGTPYQPGQVYMAHSQVIGEAISSWQPVNGSGASSLARAYNLFVNPYNPNELWAIDLGSTPPAIKVTRNGGQSWTPVPQLSQIATNYGEFDFTCGAFANGPSNYQDKDIFGNQCSMTEMIFPPSQPQMRFAILYPGGVAFSGDSGNTWQPLNATNAAAALQPVELPQSAFYDPTPNASGNSSLYVALEGRGIKRIDAPFVTLGSGIQAPPTFQALNTQPIFVLGSNGNLWLEPGPYGKLPPPGRQQVDGNVGTFQAVDANHIFVLGANGNLWFEQAPFDKVPPPGRQQVDANVQGIQAINANQIFVLGTNGNLWLEQAPFGKLPPPGRQQVDGNVGSFQALNLNQLAVLGTNGNLWLEQAPFGQVPPPGRQQIDGSVESFQALSATQMVVLARNGNLWLEEAPFGTVPPKRLQLDGNVRSFQAIDANQIVVLGANGNLWLEQAPFGTVPPMRQQIDANVASFHAIDANHILVLGTNGNLWMEESPFGKLPPARQQVDGSVRTPFGGS